MEGITKLNKKKTPIYPCFSFGMQFGEVLATTEHEETTIIAEVDYSVIELRRWIPTSCMQNNIKFIHFIFNIC